MLIVSATVRNERAGVVSQQAFDIGWVWEFGCVTKPLELLIEGLFKLFTGRVERRFVERILRCTARINTTQSVNDGVTLTAYVR
ncbi:MAG: hypothetical protein ACI9DC_004753 [Gammaproteobacteria bacterium]